MSEWWTYRLSDLILFSRDVYYRTFGLYHHGIWPAHLIVLVGLGLAAYAGGRSSTDTRRGRVVLAFIAACWLWVAIAFDLQLYLSINWAAKYFAGAFLLQGALLSWLALRGRVAIEARSARMLGIGLVILAVAAPVFGMLTGRRWDQVEVIGLTPDPTAAATILALRLSRPRVTRSLLVIPVLWCLVGGLTLYALHSAEAWWTWGSALGALAVARHPRPPHSTPPT